MAEAWLRHHSRSVYCLTWSPSGEVLATGSDDKTVALVRAADGTVAHTLRHHSDFLYRTLYCLAWSPSGEVLATGSGDATVALVRAADAYAGGIMAIERREAIEAIKTGPLELRTLGGDRLPVTGWLVHHPESQVQLVCPNLRQLAAGQHEALVGERVAARTLCRCVPWSPARLTTPWRLLLPGAVEPVEAMTLAEVLETFAPLPPAERFLVVVWDTMAAAAPEAVGGVNEFEKPPSPVQGAAMRVATRKLTEV